MEEANCSVEQNGVLPKEGHLARGNSVAKTWGRAGSWGNGRRALRDQEAEYKG